MIDKVSITRPFVLKKLSTIPPLENEDKFSALLERFFDFSLPKKFTAKTLAVELAKRTKFLKDEVVAEELKAGTSSIHGFYEAFQKFLIAGIDEDEFADLYSQTITYGLFAARLRAGEDFNRTLAFTYIPKSIGILRDIFRFISMEDIPKQMEIIIDDIAEVLSCADAKKILDQYYHDGKGSDPVLHFYETFLSEYDPTTREKRGVYYTPEPVVSFIVRSLHEILKDKFGLSDGLASKNVTLLDPAGGTLGFMYQAIEVAVKEFKEKYGDGAVKDFLKDQVLQNFYAFELMMAPYAIGHMKISFLLDELGYKMKDDERVKYYLTNTLDMQELDESKFPGMSSLSHESHQAGKIKKDVPILVILGNPPYSYDSPNKGDWISEIIKEYYQIDGKSIGEKNPKGLQDDYVKFIRFAHWKIDQAGEGVLGFITNHGYLNNPTFRGMRFSLMKSFDEIYLLDLHGNSIKKEKTPQGEKDENVFDIQQGVCIVFMIKHKRSRKKLIAHNQIYGLRAEKYEWLSKHSIKNVEWNSLEPSEDFFLFIPQDNSAKKKFEGFIKLRDIVEFGGNGLFTARDHLTIGYTSDEIWKRTRNFKELDTEIARKTYELGEDTRDWKVKLAQEDLKESGLIKENISQILYRPFDLRYTYYTGKSRGFHCMPRYELMQHLLKENIALCIGRQWSAIGSNQYDICFITNHIVDLNLYRRGGEAIFPFYLYPSNDKKDLFSDHESNEKKPNIKPEIFQQLKTDYKKEVSPEEIFYYIYAVLYSNTYRTKYAEFLKIDFPRIPFTKDYKLFIKLGKLGKELADLHLLKSNQLDKPISKFSGKGDNKVEKLKYDDGKVWINTEQHFTGVKPEVWEYQIGGYQVCEKWLKDRKERTLNLDEIQTYCKIVTALSKTIQLQKEIDENYEGVEK